MAKNKRLARGLDSLVSNFAQQNARANAEPDYERRADAVGAEFDEERDAYPSIVAFPQQNEGGARRSAISSDYAEIEAVKDRAFAAFADGRVAADLQTDLVDANPFQPRLSFEADELEDLKNSLAQHGMLQPITVRAKGERYEIIAGERRFRAAVEAGWKTVPAIVVQAEDKQMAELALTENMQRRDLDPIEKARAFRNYLDAYGGTHEELASRLALDRSTVSNLMRLLELHEEVQAMTRAGEISQGHARALLPLEKWDQLELAKRIVAEGLNVRQTESIVRNYLSGDQVAAKGPAAVSPRIQELESQFRAWLGLKIKLTSNDKGKGKLVIQFNSNDDFERVYQALKPRDF